MDVDILSVELKTASDILKYLSEELEELRVEIEFCPVIEELQNYLNKVKKLSLMIYNTVEDMNAIKHMAEI